MNQGRTLTFDEPGSPVGRELTALANRFLGAGATPIDVAKSTRLLFRRRS
jgi:hypothetical protein